MKIADNKFTMELTNEEQMVVYQMINFVDEFYQNNNQCKDYDCNQCPLRGFCVGCNTQYPIDEAVERIVKFLINGKKTIDK